MSNDKSVADTPTPPENGNDEPPTLTKRIGKTTYRVKIHFSKASKETMGDKIARLIETDVARTDTPPDTTPPKNPDKPIVPQTLTDGKEKPP